MHLNRSDLSRLAWIANPVPLEQLPGEASIRRSWTDTGSPRVSFICHTYNQVAYIDAALQGMLLQRTSFPFEVIVRDDASTDGTSDLVLKYAARYPSIIRAIVEKENRFRQGIKPIAGTFPLTRGEYLAFCEGDDAWICPNKIQEQVEFLDHNVNCSAVHSNFLQLIEIRGRWRVRLALREQRDLDGRAGAIFEAMLASNRIQTCTLLCRRSAVAQYREEGPGVDSYSVGDWPLFIHLSRVGDIGFNAQPTAVYRRTPGSLTNLSALENLKRGKDAMRMVQDFMDCHKVSDSIRERVLTSHNKTIQRLAFLASDKAAFDEATVRLHSRQSARRKLPRVLLMGALIRIPQLHRLLLAALALSRDTKHLLDFRPLPRLRQ